MAKQSKQTTKPIDYDALVKDFITIFFQEAIRLINPSLYEAIDWSVPPVFLEQELINSVQGRHKIKGKRRNTDKLAKVRLKNGKDHYVWIHLEFQHRPEEGFALRMLTYWCLIFLRYGIQDISAIVLFTGAPPPKEQRSYTHDTFGTELSYRYGCFVAVEQEEAALKQSDNPVAWGILGMQYAYHTQDDPQKRLEMKTKLFEEAAKKGISREDLIKLLIFVRDFVHLPAVMDNEFQREVFEQYFPQKEDVMKVSQGTKDFAEEFYKRAYGFSPKKLKREAAAAVREAAAAREAAAVREAAAREAAARETTAREAAARELAIIRLHKELGLAIEDIARVYGYETAYIEQVIAAAADTEQPPAEGNAAV